MAQDNIIWNWVYPDGICVRVNDDLREATVAIPDALLKSLGSTYLDHGKKSLALYLERSRAIPAANSMRQFAFSKGSDMKAGMHSYTYKANEVPVAKAFLPALTFGDPDVPPPPPAPYDPNNPPPDPGPPPFDPNNPPLPAPPDDPGPPPFDPNNPPLPAPPDDPGGNDGPPPYSPPPFDPYVPGGDPSNIPTNSNLSIQDIGDAIVQMTMQQCDELATYLHSLGVKAVFATFGQNSNVSADGIIGAAMVSASKRFKTVVPKPKIVTKAKAAATVPPPSPRKRIEDKRYSPEVGVPMVLSDDAVDHEAMWRNVYKRPVSDKDIIEDLKASKRR